MANFDHHVHPVVGTLSINESSGHGYIKVCGYLDGVHFQRLSDDEAQRIFTPNGEVFAANIQRDYYGMNNSLVSLYVMENNREGGKNAYVWDRSGGVEQAGTAIITLGSELGDDGQRNYDILKNNNLLGKSDDSFVLAGDRLYFIKGDSDSRLIPFCVFNDSLPVVGRNNSYYFFGAGLPRKDGVIDTTTDDQLVDWFLRTVKTNWEDIQRGSGKDSLRAAKDALVSMKALPVDIAESRISRLTAMTKTYAFTRDNLKQIAQAPWLQPSISSAMGRFKEDFIDELRKENEAELEQIRSKHEAQLKEEIVEHNRRVIELREKRNKIEAKISQHSGTVEQKLKANQEELERIRSEHQALLNEEIVKHNSQIVELHDKKDRIEAELRQQIEGVEQELNDSREEYEKVREKIEQEKSVLAEIQTRLSKVEERKDRIIEDFQIVRDVMDLVGGVKGSTHDQIQKQTLQYNNLSDRCLPGYLGFEANLENCLKLYKIKGVSVSGVSRIHACYKVMVLPNIQVAMSIVFAAGRSWSLTAFVSVAWKSFEDLWREGLGTVVEHCAADPDTIHYFVLRNINLSSLSNYLQPLADLQGGFIPTFPGTDKPFPANLRVLLTVSEEELLPMPENILRFFGCVTREVKVESWRPTAVTKNNIIGYLTAGQLSAADDTNDAPNCYQDYLDE